MDVSQHCGCAALPQYLSFMHLSCHFISTYWIFKIKYWSAIQNNYNCLQNYEYFAVGTCATI